MSLSSGLMKEAIPVNINKLILDYDHLVVCGPVFPHEVAGFSGGAKYFFPGIAGEEIIHLTHWLGALATAMHTIGVKDTPCAGSLSAQRNSSKYLLLISLSVCRALKPWAFSPAG